MILFGLTFYNCSEFKLNTLLKYCAKYFIPPLELEIEKSGRVFLRTFKVSI